MQNYTGLCKAGIAVVESIPFHVCRQLTIIYLLEDKLKITTVAGEQVLTKGQIEILNLKEPIMLEAVSEPCKVAYLCFDKTLTDSIDDGFETITYNCNFCNFFAAAAKPAYIQELKDKLFCICKHMQQNRSQNEIEQEARSLLEYIRKNFDDVGHLFPKSEKSDVSKERFKRISAYMIKHVSEKMSLNEIAQMEYLSIPYLSKEFSAKLEKSYHAIVNYYRTINAVIQLLDTDDSLTYIAENSGFSSVRYYNKVFSEFLNCLPSKFRAIYKNKEWKCTEEDIKGLIFQEERCSSLKNSTADQSRYILTLMKNRKSCRAFSDRPIEKAVLDQLLDAACQAPSSGGFQNYSIIKVTEESKKRKLMEVCRGQSFIAKAPVNLIFCMDLHREKRIAESFHGISNTDYSYEEFVMLIMDAVIAAQNLCIAAESFGLGSVYVGNIINMEDQVVKLLRLPEKVLPVIMVTLGYPKQEGSVSLKYPKEILVHEETYQEKSLETLREAFDEKYADWKMKPTNKTLTVIEREAEKHFGTDYAKKCIETIKDNNRVDAFSFWYGFYYANRDGMLTNEELWTFLKKQDLDFTK
ncbi:MAG: nitroreductase family protein [Emergencia sp.]